MIIDPTNVKNIYVAGQVYQNSKLKPAVHRTSNGGQTWKTTALSGSLGMIKAIAVDPKNPNTLYAGGYIRPGSTSKGALFKSTNGGQSWKEISKNTFSINYEYVTIIKIHPQSNNIVYVYNDDYIYRSENFGSSWKKIDRNNYDGGYVEDLILDPKSTKKLFIANKDGVYYSGDKGGSWTQINKGLSNPNALCLAINSAKNYLFTGTNGGGVFRSIVKSLK